ncbi:uncharacterized protein LOC132798851 isoform X2 [Drosophila nasuta]|uniref:uncharacterized protein LOC132798851 isoform X2 n=1 Tax=Drosophila nasuta TaxID=42062 RepID=UPI00295E6AE3|nr:uncharacterized protein LOC132798851 isoform X2 [Drosophila nasuta]
MELNRQGALCENASEERKKLYKLDMLSHARKNSRLNTISDVFNRALDSSDPLLSTINLKERRRLNYKKSLPRDVIVALLESPDIELPITWACVDEKKAEIMNSGRVTWSWMKSFVKNKLLTGHQGICTKFQVSIFKNGINANSGLFAHSALRVK